MNHNDHVNLLRGGIPAPGGIWADLGAGAGAFTLALADSLGANAQIYAVDQDAGVLRENQRAMRSRFPDVNVNYITADFTQKLDLPQLDGLVMANSLHFHRDKVPILQRVHGYSKSDGRFILIEYNVDSGNTWVPYPLSYSTWAKMAAENGFSQTRQLAAYPSRFLREIYSAISIKF